MATSSDSQYDAPEGKHNINGYLPCKMGSIIKTKGQQCTAGRAV